MLPVIFSVGPITLYSFGLVLFVTFFAFTFVVWKQGKELHFDEEQLFDSLFIILFWFVIGARLGYVLLHWEDFSRNLWQVFNFFGRPGLVYFTGLVSGTVASILQAKARKWDVYSLGDLLAVAMSLALSLLSLGMFLNGTGAGRETDWFIGIQFVGLLEKRLPVQLLEMVMYAGLFGLLWWLESRYRTFSWYKGKKSEANSGFLLAVFLIGHGVIGFIASLLRSEGLQFFDVRVDWWLYVLLVILGVTLLLFRSGLKFMDQWRKGRKNR